jgi:hypothetical protein
VDSVQVRIPRQPTAYECYGNNILDWVSLVSSSGQAGVIGLGLLLWVALPPILLGLTLLVNWSIGVVVGLRFDHEIVSLTHRNAVVISQRVVSSGVPIPMSTSESVHVVHISDHPQFDRFGPFHRLMSLSGYGHQAIVWRPGNRVAGIKEESDVFLGVDLRNLLRQFGLNDQFDRRRYDIGWGLAAILDGNRYSHGLIWKEIAQTWRVMRQNNVRTFNVPGRLKHSAIDQSLNDGHCNEADCQNNHPRLKREPPNKNWFIRHRDDLLVAFVLVLYAVVIFRLATI